MYPQKEMTTYAEISHSIPSAPSHPQPIIVSSQAPVLIQVAQDQRLDGFYCRKKTIVIFLYIALVLMGLALIGPIVYLAEPKYDNKNWAIAVLLILLLYFAFNLSVLIAAQRENLCFMKVYFRILIGFFLCACVSVVRYPVHIGSVILQGLWLWLIYRFVQDLKIIKERQEECALPEYSP